MVANPVRGHKEVPRSTGHIRHGDNPLLGPTGIQIGTKSYATLQAMAPTNNNHEEVLSLQPMFPPKPLDTLPLEVDAQKV